MSISYYVCKNCGNSFPEFENYTYCEKCNADFCEKCSEKMELKVDDETYSIINCPSCSGQLIDDHEFNTWLIDTFYFGNRQKAEDDFRSFKNNR